jgi:phosphohistidine phosphatase
MDLILWRHAEAEEEAPAGDDLQRPLTSRGEKQAAQVAAWLDRQLPDGVRILCSPALRCEQTVLTLGRKYRIQEELGPKAKAADLLSAARWPDGKGTVLIVGHQPVLGRAIAEVLQLPQGECPVKKGAVWWLRSREKGEGMQTMVVAVQSAEHL